MMWTMKSFGVIIVLFFVIGSTKTQTEEGEDCVLENGLPGVCTSLRFCKKLQKKGANRQFCSLTKGAIVCCPSDVVVPTTTARIVNRYVRPNVEECEFPPEAITVNRTRNISWNKCIDLADSVFPCQRAGFVPGSLKIRIDTCQHTAKTLVFGGEDAERNEFPHMAALGYENVEMQRIDWDCGGSLISEQWVMTAAHCTHNRQNNVSVKYVKLGALFINGTDGFIFEVIEKKNHPRYNQVNMQNDIALLRLNITVTYSNAILPACIHVGNSLNATNALVIGWGLTENATKSNVLKKVVITKFSTRECRKKHPSSFLNPDGIVRNMHLCYGSKTEIKDTCYGDSGGPLQVYNYGVHCTYTVIGITSKGKSCGYVGTPGIYTKVSTYVSWIESVVWPLT